MKKIILSALSLVLSTGLWAQGAHDFKISEVYIATSPCCTQTTDTMGAQGCCRTTVDSYADEYGDHPSWIEIQNTSYSTHDIRSCYLTNRREAVNPDLTAPERIAMMSLIPKGDARTNLAGKQQITFFADSHVNRGTLHTSFTLSPGDFIALYDGNGVTLLDSLTLPKDIPAGCSYARVYDKDADAYKWLVAEPNQVTANAPNNIGTYKEDKIAEWKSQDPHGIAMAIISMGIVFACLILLFVFFHIFGWTLARISLLNRVKAIKAIHEQAERIVVMAKDGSETKGIEMENYAAAIGMALHEYLGGTHDVESGVITIEHHHSEWDSKDHMLRHAPEVHHNA